jgi:hypothetical protein
VVSKLRIEKHFVLKNSIANNMAHTILEVYTRKVWGPVSVEEAQYLPPCVFSSRLFVIHDSRGCGENYIPAPERWEGERG